MVILLIFAYIYTSALIIGYYSLCFSEITPHMHLIIPYKHSTWTPPHASELTL